MKCSECTGKVIFLRGDKETNLRLRERKVCTNCDYWLEFVSKKDDPRSIRIEGQHYFHGPAVGTTNGMRFPIHVLFHDGRDRTYHNLVKQGRIPRRFKRLLPNNAIFQGGN